VSASAYGVTSNRSSPATPAYGQAVMLRTEFPHASLVVTNQSSIFVHEGQRHAVKLQLAYIVDVFAPAQLVHAPFPGSQLFLAIGIVEREHGRGVRYFDDPLARFATDPLRR